MITVEIEAIVPEDRKVVVQLPVEVEPGQHRIRVEVDAQPVEPISDEERAALGFPIIHVDSWPADLSLRREDMYDEWGR